MRTFVAALCFVIASASSGPRWHQLSLDYTHDHYCRDFAKRYSATEKVKREAEFNRRLRSILMHNADTSVSYKRGINQFADWTDDEFRRYNTYKRSSDEVRKGLHRRFQKEDAARAMPLPSQVDYRKSVPPVLTAVKNQGACGSCWAHSTVEAVESMFAIKYGQLPVLSVQQVLSCTTSMFGCGGGDYFSGWSYVQTNAAETTTVGG